MDRTPDEDFNVGDKVRICNDGSEFWGRIGIITGFTSRGNALIKFKNGDHGMWACADSLKLAYPRCVELNDPIRADHQGSLADDQIQWGISKEVRV